MANYCTAFNKEAEAITKKYATSFNYETLSFDPPHECEVIQRLSELYRKFLPENLPTKQTKYAGKGIFQVKGTMSTGPK